MNRYRSQFMKLATVQVFQLQNWSQPLSACKSTNSTPKNHIKHPFGGFLAASQNIPDFSLYCHGLNGVLIWGFIRRFRHGDTRRGAEIQPLWTIENGVDKLGNCLWKSLCYIGTWLLRVLKAKTNAELPMATLHPPTLSTVQ